MLQLGEVSLSLKMYEAYFWMLSKDANNILLIEDDSELAAGRTINDVQMVINMVPPNYAILQLGSCLFSASKERMSFLRVEPTLGNNKFCTGAYAISKQGAILLFKMLPLSHPIDHMMISWWGVILILPHMG